MKIETLKERIKKTQENIEKSTATLERHKTQLAKKAKLITSEGIDLSNYDKFNRTIINHDMYWTLCEYEHKLEDVEKTEEKIADYNKTLDTLKKQLKDQLAKDKENTSIVPKALTEFLAQWKARCIEHFTKVANDYLAIVNKPTDDYEITENELAMLTKETYNRTTRNYETVPYYSVEQTERILHGEISPTDRHYVRLNIKNRHIKTFTVSHFANTMTVVYKVTEGNNLDLKKLNKILDEEVRIKRDMFLARVKEVIGDIRDLSGLKISAKGEINGIAKGVKCNAKVETIGAGGYNIQCFHFRVLVNTVK